MSGTMQKIGADRSRRSPCAHRTGGVPKGGYGCRGSASLWAGSILATIAFVSLVAIGGRGVGTSNGFDAPRIVVETSPNLTVALLGDHGTGPDARSVLRLIKGENADLVLSQGDLGYEASPEAFFRMVDDILGPDFPFFASLGNHDRSAWRAYNRLLRARIARLPDARCEGVIGLKAACTYKGLFFITSGVEVFFLQLGWHHAAFMSRALAGSPSRWRICSWHYTQRAMQVGGKDDQTGWGVYEACRNGGAIIATGHEHSYSRTYLIGRFSDPPEVASRDGSVLHIGPGRTVAIVSGLGGQSVRPQTLVNDWWAAVHTATQDAAPGALFCTFNPDGQADRANCYFKDITGRIADRFQLVATPLERGAAHTAGNLKTTRRPGRLSPSTTSTSCSRATAATRLRPRPLPGVCRLLFRR